MRSTIIGIRTIFAIAPFALFLLTVSCTSINPTYDETEEYRRKLWQQCSTLSNLSIPQEKNTEFYNYASGILQGEHPPVKHLAGTIPSGPYSLFVHIFLPETNITGSVFVFHGYATDSSHYGRLASELLTMGLATILIDLPGHGLSTGTRGDAWPGFYIYGDSVNNTITNLSPYLPRPYYAIGHSTGGLALIDYSMRYKTQIEKIVLFAPLMKLPYQGILTSVRTITSIFAHSYRAFARTKLGLRVFPFTWLDYFVIWQKKLEKTPHIDMPSTLLILAAKDNVVDNDYSKKKLRNKIDTIYIITEKNADHFELDSGAPDEDVMADIKGFLSDTISP
ncbi:alpha/beta hydrolase [Spirochaetia bacterium 38H-sp]|uniref:Alpha/beta hydrolase n=1 Tax=Rarispira pelagica TaxID=3141764 RepID=A0ABU9UA59_9SPIR